MQKKKQKNAKKVVSERFFPKTDLRFYFLIF